MAIWESDRQDGQPQITHWLAVTPDKAFLLSESQVLHL